MKEGCLFVLFYGFRSTSIYEGRLFVCFVLWVLKHIYLWRKVVCLFCFVCTDEIHPTRMLQIAFLVSLESSWRVGVNWLGFIAFGLAVQKFLNIEWFLHWRLNKILAENFQGIGMCLWCCWKDLQWNLLGNILDSECESYWFFSDFCHWKFK